MSIPRSSATIEFPVARIDGEIRKVLEEEGVQFKPPVFGISIELDSPVTLELADSQLYDLEVEVEEGIFRLHNPEARYGEFSDLEELLVKKGIPFERESSMDWDRPPVTRVFRPGDPLLDVEIPDGEESSGPLVRLMKAAKAVLLAFTNVPIIRTPELEEFEAAIKEAERTFPDYPPLEDCLKMSEVSLRRWAKQTSKAMSDSRKKVAP
jgi:hypothetical protein